jgi:PAS domain S-box-containing protein
MALEANGAGKGLLGRNSSKGYILTNPALLDNPIVYVSDSFAVLTGYSPSEVIGRNCRFLQGPQTDTAALVRIRDAITRSHDVSEIIMNYRKDGRCVCACVLACVSASPSHLFVKPPPQQQQ